MLEDAVVVAEGNAQNLRVVRPADVLQTLVAAGALRPGGCFRGFHGGPQDINSGLRLITLGPFRHVFLDPGSMQNKYQVL